MSARVQLRASTTSWARASVLVVLAATLASTVSVVTAAAANSKAHLSRTMSVKDEGRLKLVRSSGALLVDEGPASGTLPGRVRVQFVYKGEPTVDATITVLSRSGSITARGNGRLSSLTNADPSFSGTLTISGGSGRYAGAHGSGRLYGVFNRRTYAMIVQTQGTVRL